jgi:hypothetical protein
MDSDQKFSHKWQKMQSLVIEKRFEMLNYWWFKKFGCFMYGNQKWVSVDVYKVIEVFWC